MSGEWVAVLLLALAGFLGGGVYSTWKNNSRGLSVALGAAALLSIGGAITWLA
ncbi:hypothetical protein ABZ863_15180 [Saccharomonospora sp. NPDC046836]|uniref:hypothetical protein n=1 Tax=Saccharomonospora sp. NPDC046836 TaxID=3156921 RepID=UPI0033FC33BD